MTPPTHESFGYGPFLVACVCERVYSSRPLQLTHVNSHLSFLSSFIFRFPILRFASYVEIYQETIADLLSDSKPTIVYVWREGQARGWGGRLRGREKESARWREWERRVLIKLSQVEERNELKPRGPLPIQHTRKHESRLLHLLLPCAWLLTNPLYIPCKCPTNPLQNTTNPFEPLRIPLPVTVGTAPKPKQSSCVTWPSGRFRRWTSYSTCWNKGRSTDTWGRRL